MMSTRCLIQDVFLSRLLPVGTYTTLLEWKACVNGVSAPCLSQAVFLTVAVETRCVVLHRLVLHITVLIVVVAVVPVCCRRGGR